MANGRLAVIYLCRGADGGVAAADAFLQSYTARTSGIAHDLIFLTKGWDDASARGAVEDKVSRLGGRSISLPDDGFDLGAYFRAIVTVDQNHVCFLNTHSRILSDNWLGHLYAAALQPGVGAAGASGSWQSYFYTELDRWRRESIAYKARHLGRLVKAARRYPMRFPNMFLRTNAFVIARDTFAAFAEAREIPRGRDHVGPLENGRISLTGFLNERGQRVVVVGADGRVFERAEWAASGTYVSPGQPNLMVSDNRTRAYDAMDRHAQQALERLVWGKTSMHAPTAQR